MCSQVLVNARAILAAVVSTNKNRLARTTVFTGQSVSQPAIKCQPGIAQNTDSLKAVLFSAAVMTVVQAAAAPAAVPEDAGDANHQCHPVHCASFLSASSVLAEEWPFKKWTHWHCSNLAAITITITTIWLLVMHWTLADWLDCSQHQSVTISEGKAAAAAATLPHSLYDSMLILLLSSSPSSSCVPAGAYNPKLRKQATLLSI